MPSDPVAKRRNWTREETLAAFNLYARTPFGRLHARNPEIISLARQLGRTASAVAMKCCNLAALDPALQSRGIKGLRGISDLDRQVWGDFHRCPEDVGYESEISFAKTMRQPLRMAREDDPVVAVAGTDREVLRRVRVTQHLFRGMILSSYRERCAVCTLPARELLVASHIVAWAVDEANRMNPRNGICLCSLHDRAFDTGLIDIDGDYRVHVTRRCRVDRNHGIAKAMLYHFDGTSITLPDRWLPDPELLAQHRRQLVVVG
jgi:putative restriction endonuclease